MPDPEANMPKVFAGIIVFRVIYFLLPLVFGAVLLGWHEYALRKKWIPPSSQIPTTLPTSAAGRRGMNGRAGKNGTAEVKRSVTSE